MGFLYQGSAGAIGDLFLSSHIAYNMHINNAAKVSVAIPKSLRETKEDVYYLYHRHAFLDLICELEQNDAEGICKEASVRGLTPSIYLQSIQHYNNIKFCNIDKWFKNKDISTITFSRYIIVHVASSENWSRPPIPHLREYISHIVEAGYTPIMIGTKKDEELCNSMYPWLKDVIMYEQAWRFGKDNLESSLSNIYNSSGVFSFSSWSSIYGALCGKPVLELWNVDQWLYFSQTVKYMLGSPIHLMQNLYNAPITANYFKHCFPYFQQYNKMIYK